MRLKQLRKERKLLQRQVADAINCSQAVYSRYENGEREPSREVLSALADMYGVTIDYLVGRDDETPVTTEQAPATPSQPQHGPETLAIIEAIKKKLDQLAAYEDGGVEEISKYVDYQLAQRLKEDK